MASSSSSSHSASISQSWNHEVFLSFRGEDTRKTFVDHLYTALVQQGIQTYKDDETLARGESIGPALFKAIQESRIAVVVFSENYADSSWCLDELAYIIECMDTRGQIVMPVFYDVDPSDVRKQNGKYREAFDKHEVENKHKVELWRKALLKAGNLSGWVPKDFANGHEAKCVKNIVSTISGRSSLQTTDANKDLIGIESRLLDLKSKLEIGSGGVRMVGIWGVGGGGKTTLASAVYMEISHQFEVCCLLENIRDESRKHGLKRLQELFLSLVLKTNVVFGSEVEGKSMIKRRLCHKSVLLVLDDVDDLKQLEALAGSHDWFGDGSWIIITTRDEHLLTHKADMIYEVSLLSHDEAIKLFTRHAYREDKPVEDYNSLSLEVVSYADGLPLALVILGSFLYDKNKDEWINTLAKLKCIPNVKVTEQLKISYDGLEHDEKELFLDIACFFRRWQIDEAMTVLDACSFHPRIGVKVLVQKSLIKVSTGKIDMHDLVEEMAHYIVRGEHPNDPGKHSRIWQEKDIVDFCAMNTETLLENCYQNEIFALSRYFNNPSVPRVGASNRPPRWDLLMSSLPSYFGHPRLPDVVASMKKLRWICWEGYPAASLPTNFQPTKLGCLMLISGLQKQLWNGCKHLPNLKVLDLRFSEHLIRTPDFNGLPCLERLNLMFCEKLKTIHPSIGYHERLVYVNMKYCQKLKTFPPITRMKKLETLDLGSCYQLQKFPDIQANMDSLVNLCFSSTGIEIIPPSLGMFCTNLVSFDSRYCIKLKKIEVNFHLLKRLKDFHLYGCYQLEKLAWDFFDKECCLEVLSLRIKTSEDSSSFKNLMNHIGLHRFHQDSSMSMKLPQFPRYLKKLYIGFCNLGDGDIPSDICELINLQVLDLRCNKFSRLHSCLSGLPCLKFLRLSQCSSLVELPDLPSTLAVLDAVDCVSLESVEDLSNYKWLWKVSLSRLNKLSGRERVVHSLLQVNAVEDRFMSVAISSGPQVPYDSLYYSRTFTLQLPQNWYNDFSGFLLSADNVMSGHLYIIVIKQETSMDSQPDHWEEFNKNPESYEYGQVGYIPFGSLRQTPWWNSTYTNITFQITGQGKCKVGLVPRKSKLGDLRERPKATVDCSGFWDEEWRNKKTFEIECDSKSSNIKIVWSHSYFPDLYREDETYPW